MQKIEEITPQIAALYLGAKCQNSNGSVYTVSNTDIQNLCSDAEPWRKLTLHLRRLSSITAKEARPLYGGCDEDAFKSFLEWHRGIKPNKALWSPVAFLYLLSKGFDLFGLIDSGLAIEIK